MPEEHYNWLAKTSILTFEEIHKIVRCFVRLGVQKVRITGGEPLLRPQVDRLVSAIFSEQSLHEVALTTNGTLLARSASKLKESGLSRVTVSLDTLKNERFRALARRDKLADVLLGIASLRRAGFQGTKIDTVVINGLNHDELPSLIEYSRSVPAEVRFIEYMDVGGATNWAHEKVLPRKDMLSIVESVYGEISPIARSDSAPAERFRLKDGKTFGIIASTTSPFCADCDRSRLTADGLWYHCLYAPNGTDLRTPVRDGASEEELGCIIAHGWRRRSDRGAEERERFGSNRLPLVDAASLSRDPHLEMHTRGG
jgi:cyclic pyranopterin phosphate synthase